MNLNLLRDFSTRSLLFLLLYITGAGNVWGEEYELVTSTNELVAGDRYIIASMKSGVGAVMAKYVPNENNCGQIEATSANNKITYITDMALLTLGGSSGNWVFHDGTYYMTATNTKSANHLKGVKNVDGYHEFSISINSSGIATIKCKGKDSHDYLRHNSDYEIFSCYDSSKQSQVYLYKEVKNTNKEITSIAITGTPVNTTYYVGDTPSAEGLVVTATYSDNSTENVTEETEWTFDPSVIETSTTSIIATARYEGMIAEKTFNITRKSIANTKANPYSVAEAYTITDAGKGLGEEVYVIGIVVKVEEISIGHLTYWISDDGTTSKTFQCLQGLGIEAKEFDSNTDFTIGSRVIVKGRLQKVNGTYGFKKNNILNDYYALSYIAIEGNATKTSYFVDESPDASGLTVIAKYSDESTLDITQYATWSFFPQTISKNTTEVQATALFLNNNASCTIPISVKEIVYNLIPVIGETGVYDSPNPTGIYIEGVTWFVKGISNEVPWKIGGKSIEKQDRHIKTSTPIYGTVEKVVVNVGGTSGDITLNSIKLSVANNASFTNSTNYNITDNLKANKDYVFQIPPTENAYYRITYNLTVSGSNNKYYELKGAQFLGTSASYTLNVSDAGFATLCLPYNAVVPEGVVAYTTSENGEYIRLTTIPNNTIAANEGVVLKAPHGEYSFTSTYKQATSKADNLMIGVTKDTPLTATDKAYMLTRKKEGGNVAFRLLNTNYTLGANKAYLKLKESDNARDVISVQWDDDETGIIETITLDNNKETVIYNLSGQKLKQTQKGINIINGKLVIR